MDEEQKVGVINGFHISLGSAATTIHVSTDLSFDDPNKYSRIDELFELYEKCRLKRSLIDARFKK